MRNKNAPQQESSGYDLQPARIVLQNGEEFDVVHHDRTENDRWVFAYVETRENGIDYRFPAESVLYIDTTSDDGDSDAAQFKQVEDVADAPDTVITAGVTPPTIEEDEDDEGDEDETLVADGGQTVGQVTLTGDEADEALVKHRTAQNVEPDGIEQDDSVRYREEFYDQIEDEWASMSMTYWAGHINRERGTVEIECLGRDGEGGRERYRLDVVDIEDLSRCVECGTLKAYDDPVCDECADYGGSVEFDRVEDVADASDSVMGASATPPELSDDENEVSR